MYRQAASFLYGWPCELLEVWCVSVILAVVLVYEPPPMVESTPGHNGPLRVREAGKLRSIDHCATAMKQRFAI